MVNFFFQAEDGIRDGTVTGVQTCALPIFADLKGKAIGVTAPGATTWLLARMLAKQQGWNPDKDVQIVALGGLDAQIAALSRKETAGFVWGDGGAVFEQQKKSKILMRLDQVAPKWISLNQYATEESIKKHADTIRKA